MIEKFFKNENSRKAWRRFKKNKSAVLSAFLLILIIIFSLTAEVWANRKPIVMTYHGHTFFPVFKYYHPSLFGQEDVSQTDYRTLKFENGDWAVWPLIHWDPYERNEKIDEFPSPPTRSNIFGTDEGGRDVAAIWSVNARSRSSSRCRF
jgi:microcin C transport system permease protein